MKQYTIELNDSCLESENLKDLLLTFIEDNLNALKLQNLSNWVKDQNCNTAEIDGQINKLKEIRNTICALDRLDNIELDLKINLPIKSQKVA